MVLCDFIATNKQWQIIVGLLQVLRKTRYNGNEFNMFNGIATLISPSILLKWILELATKEAIEHLCFESSKIS